MFGGRSSFLGMGWGGGGGLPGHCRMLTGIMGLPTADARSHLPTHRVTTRNVSRHYQMPPWDKIVPSREPLHSTNMYEAHLMFVCPGKNAGSERK